MYKLMFCMSTPVDGLVVSLVTSVIASSFGQAGLYLPKMLYGAVCCLSLCVCVLTDFTLIMSVMFLRVETATPLHTTSHIIISYSHFSVTFECHSCVPHRPISSENMLPFPL